MALSWRARQRREYPPAARLGLAVSHCTLLTSSESSIRIVWSYTRSNTLADLHRIEGHSWPVRSSVARRARGDNYGDAAHVDLVLGRRASERPSSLSHPHQHLLQPFRMPSSAIRICSAQCELLRRAFHRICSTSHRNHEVGARRAQGAIGASDSTLIYPSGKSPVQPGMLALVLPLRLRRRPHPGSRSAAVP